MKYYYCQWLDIQNRSINITLTKNFDLVEDVQDFSLLKGKLYIKVFSIGECDEEFCSHYPGLLSDFILKDVDDHNYRVCVNVIVDKLMNTLNYTKESGEPLTISLSDITENENENKNE
jgi:hypothetical protein